MKSKKMIKVMFSLVALVLLMGCATQKAVTPVINAVDLNPRIVSGQLAQKVDAFAVIFDSTTSMNEVYKKGTKLGQEKSLVSMFNDTIPMMKLTASARAFGQFAPFDDATSKPLFAPTAYSKSLLPQAMEPIKSGLGFSPLDAGLDGTTADLKSQTGLWAVVAFSDGEDMEKYDPVAAAERMRSAYGDRVCIYTVHLGENEEGGKLMQKVADAGQCGFMVTGESVSTPEGMADFVERVLLKTAVAERRQEVAVLDSDGDGVADSLDKCPGTPVGVQVNGEGCPLDTDGDGVYDYLDKHPGTPAGVKVDQNGVPLDTDGDGVYDYLDKHPGTPAGVKVDQDGIPLDTDGDGVYDYLDKHPGTPAGVKVDQNGVPLDTDGDGVYDYLDKCPGTPAGVQVDLNGCLPPVVQKAEPQAAIAVETAIVEKGRATLNVEFDFDKADIRKEYAQEIGSLAAVMKKYPDLKILLEGHTDSIGGEQYNEGLSQRRAEAVKKYLVEKLDIEASRLTTEGYGLTRPIASNATKEGRQKNRRVDATAEYFIKK